MDAFRWLCKISGMIDESMDKGKCTATTCRISLKASYQRLIIMLGGVTVNFILAFIIYIGMAFAYGDTYVANTGFKTECYLKILRCKALVSKRETKSWLPMGRNR
jgi:regulator of sigma E protease